MVSWNALEVFLYFTKMLKSVPRVNMDTWLVVSLFVFVQLFFSLAYEGKELQIFIQPADQRDLVNPLVSKWTPSI